MLPVKWRGLDVLRAHYSYATYPLVVSFSQQQLMMVLSFHFQDLVKDLTSELSGDFRKMVMATLKTPAQFDASELHSAIKVSAQEQLINCSQYFQVIMWLCIVKIFAYVSLLGLNEDSLIKNKQAGSYRARG